MPFNIADFNSEIATTGIASTSHFEAWILGGPGSHYGVSRILQEYGMNDGMRFRIESVNMPGRQLITLDQNYYGPTRRIPYRTAQQPITLSIILSKDMREREVFMKWQDYFAGHYRTNTNRSNIPGSFDGKYYQDGIGTIAILQLSQPIETDLLTLARIGSQVIPKFFNPNQNLGKNVSAGTQIASKVLRFFDQPSFQIQNTITLVEAYPTSVNDIQMSWGDEGYAKMTVEINYRYTIEDNSNFGDGGNFERERRNRVR
jgi:hypothetical protein